MPDYTPTTAKMFEAYYSYLRYTSRTSRDAEAEFNRWLAEVKAQAWEEGAIWQRANAVPDDRRMRARFVGELQAVNPYREGTK